MLEGDGEVAGGVGGKTGTGLTCVLLSGYTAPIDVCCYFYTTMLDISTRPSRMAMMSRSLLPTRASLNTYLGIQHDNK